MGVVREPVTGTVLSWAIDESGYALGEIAAQLKVSEATVQHWIEETDQPTKGQLTRLARCLHRPRLLFFLPHPPAESTAAHFRQAATQMEAIPLTPAERLILRRAQRIQRIVSSLMCLDAQASVSLPQVAIQDDPAVAGRILRSWAAPCHTSEHRNFAQWRAEFQKRGILVLTLPVRQGNQKIPSFLRGFALPDPYAPTIALNTADNLPARSFTLFHELAHLATDTVQSCGPAAAPYSEANRSPSSAAFLQERWCDAVAGNALIPPQELHKWIKTWDDTDLGLVRQVARHFKVSFRAAAVSLIQADAISASVYEEVKRTWPLLDRTRDSQKGEGRTRSQIKVDEWGGKAIRTIFAAYDRRQISETNLRRWFDMVGPEIDEVRELAQALA